MSSLPTPDSLRASVPDDADRSYIVADLRSLAVPISSLLPDPRNARKHPEKNLDAVKASLRSFGQRKPVVVNSRTLIVEAGNGTLEAAKAIGWQYVAAVFQDDDAVTATGYGLADNRSAELAEWDTDVLTDLIKDLKVDGVDVSDLGWSGEDLLAMLPDEDGPGGEDDNNPYTQKIEAPIYKITGKKPEISELFDHGKSIGLLDAIDKADISDEDKRFLRQAAQRHVVFNYHNIAEYYAHASPSLQRLMEDSALVIIDYNRAIELGYVKVSEAIDAQRAEEYPND